MMTVQAEKASRLLALHQAPQPLVLVNAWDAASACIVEKAGFPAIATTSAGVANALGYADGQRVPWAEMEQAIRKIAHAVETPVTADIEAGFGASLQELEATIEGVIKAGAVGINLEDKIPDGGAGRPLYPVAEQLERIRSARRVGESLHVHLVINARTDAYWRSVSTPEEALKITLERGRAYLDGGAAMGELRRICEEAASAGTYNTLSQDAVSHVEMNAFFNR